MLNPKSFKCSRCGECCKRLYVLLSQDDIKKIEELGYGDDSFSTIEYIGEFKGKRALRKKDGKCIFLAEGNKCLIYCSRPDICKKYPFFGKPVESCLNQHNF